MVCVGQKPLCPVHDSHLITTTTLSTSPPPNIKPVNPMASAERQILVEILEGILTHCMMNNAERKRCFDKLKSLPTP